MVLLGVPVQMAVNVPDVRGVPPTLKLTLPKFISVIVKLHDCAKVDPAEKSQAINITKTNLTDIAAVQSKFASQRQL